MSRETQRTICASCIAESVIFLKSLVLYIHTIQLEAGLKMKPVDIYWTSATPNPPAAPLTDWDV